jgi:transcription-repair coupling factor (superfamily II helicase)
MSDAEWSARMEEHDVVQVLEAGDNSEAAVPSFAMAGKPAEALAAFLKRELKAKRRIVLAAADDKELRALVRRAAQAVRRQPSIVEDWEAVLAAKPARVLALKLDLDGGFIDEEDGVAVVTAADVFGSRARRGEGGQPRHELADADAEFRIGDAVVHLDRGMGLLQGLETVTTDVAGASDLVRLEYAEEDKLLAPVEELEGVAEEAG